MTLAPEISESIALVQGEKPAAGVYRRKIKRILDLLLVLISAPIVVPLVILLAVLVMMDGEWPFYTQERVGRHGQHYRIWKIRTMVPHAEAALAAHLAADPAARAEWDQMQKLKFDPRITPIGRALRKTSLDELPQLWNVLKGDMSLVGPRPILPEQRPLYPGTAYYRLRPGLTGPWQVSERNRSTFAERANYDQDYDARLSLGTDLGLLTATVRVVLKGTGT